MPSVEDHEKTIALGPFGCIHGHGRDTCRASATVGPFVMMPAAKRTMKPPRANVGSRASCGFYMQMHRVVSGLGIDNSDAATRASKVGSEFLASGCDAEALRSKRHGIGHIVGKTASCHCPDFRGSLLYGLLAEWPVHNPSQSTTGTGHYTLLE